MNRLMPLFLLVITGATSCSLLNPSTSDPSPTPSTPNATGSATTQTAPTAPQPQGTVLTSADGRTQITVPEDWSSMTDLNAVASIQAANLNKEQYVIVIEDSKQDFSDASLDYHSEVTSQLIVDGLTAPEADAPVPMTVNGHAALQKEIRGSFDNINVIYLHTSIETPTHFYQVLTWSLKSRFEENRSIFEQVTQSFQEVAS